jgi:hypothetical protein
MFFIDKDGHKSKTYQLLKNICEDPFDRFYIDYLSHEKTLEKGSEKYEKEKEKYYKFEDGLIMRIIYPDRKTIDFVLSNLNNFTSTRIFVIFEGERDIDTEFFIESKKRIIAKKRSSFFFINILYLINIYFCIR